jgi:hypothetical protein
MHQLSSAYRYSLIEEENEAEACKTNKYVIILLKYTQTVFNDIDTKLTLFR